MQDNLYHAPDLAAFYDWDNLWTADFDFFASLVAERSSVLDLGCGTGVFAAALAARGAEVVGVDPAAAMLEVARARAERVTWVEARAQSLDLQRRFEAVVMTGHAFQTLLTPEDRALVLATIARHLAPGGRFLLDSRNPEAREWKAWGRAATHEVRAHPQPGMVERWNEAAETGVPGIIEYQTHYVLPGGRHLQARSRIGFPEFEELSAPLAVAGCGWTAGMAMRQVGPCGPDAQISSRLAGWRDGWRGRHCLRRRGASAFQGFPPWRPAYIPRVV